MKARIYTNEHGHTFMQLDDQEPVCIGLHPLEVAEVMIDGTRLERVTDCNGLTAFVTPPKGGDA